MPELIYLRYRPDNTLAPSGTAVITMSPKSIVTSDRATLFARCQNCVTADGVPEVFTADSVQLSLFLSDASPQFLSSGQPLANLPLDGVEEAPFVLDTKAARSENFESLLRAAGFQD